MHLPMYSAMTYIPLETLKYTIFYQCVGRFDGNS